jgi:hypothetical protein
MVIGEAGSLESCVMVGDLHFVIRHGLTGFAFLLFLAFGIWNVELWFREGCDISFYIVKQSERSGAPAAEQSDDPAEMSTPALRAPNCTSRSITYGTKDSQFLVLAIATLIGITLQGIQISWMYRRRQLFTDPARQNISERVQQVIDGNVENLIGDDLKHAREYLNTIARSDPDALYVWVYHYTKDNELLIEWARRRRSYHYLGRHLSVAFMLGTLIGACIGVVSNFPPRFNYPALEHVYLQLGVQASLLLLCIGWARAAWYLATPTKKDADFMEFAWSLGCLYPDFRRKVFGENLMLRDRSEADCNDIEARSFPVMSGERR